MNENIVFSLALASALGSGLMAGVFFAFSTFVMRALARQPAAHGIAAMQSINVTVLNPWFLGVFFGTAVTNGMLALGLLVLWPAPGTWLLLAGSALYLLGTFLVTMVCNVPWNNRLAATDAASAAGQALWARYVSRWTMWNHVRTVAALTALAAFFLAIG